MRLTYTTCFRRLLPLSLLWGYDNTLPITQVANATFQEVSQHLQLVEID